MNGLKTKKAHRNDVPFSWVFYIFYIPGITLRCASAIGATNYLQEYV